MTKLLLLVWVPSLAVLGWYVATRPWLMVVLGLALLAGLVAAVARLRANPRPDPAPEHLTHA